MRPCLVCKSIWRTNSGLCPHCAGRLFALRNPRARGERGVTVRSLFTWRLNDLRVYAWMLASLKRQEDPRVWRRLALWMADAFRRERPPATLVPVPSRGPNHALGLARALAEWTGWPVENVLLSEGPEQKTLSREERRRVRLSAQICKDFTSVVIVDDVVTTGATALAAYKALGGPANCEVWCLLDRRLL